MSRSYGDPRNFLSVQTTWVAYEFKVWTPLLVCHSIARAPRWVQDFSLRPTALLWIYPKTRVTAILWFTVSLNLYKVFTNLKLISLKVFWKIPTCPLFSSPPYPFPFVSANMLLHHEVFFFNLLFVLLILYTAVILKSRIWGFRPSFFIMPHLGKLHIHWLLIL